MASRKEDNLSIALWGRTIGAATWDAERRLAVFQYAPDFVASGIELSPIRMPLRHTPYDFPGLPGGTFHGLPGLLEDSLPDKYGTAILDRLYVSTGRIAEDVHSIARLQTIGRSGMGALEYEPEERLPQLPGNAFDIETAYVLANQLFDDSGRSDPQISGNADPFTLELLLPGMFAGGAKPKAVLLWHPELGYSTNDADVERGFEYWLIKFDASRPVKDREDPTIDGYYGVIEYCYYKMAKAAGIKMTPCRLQGIAGRRHFMTRRFDRTQSGGKVMMQSLGALTHYDYNRPGAYSYEQCLQVIRRLDLPTEDLEQQTLRTFFNVVARNQDDHVNNIAFLMDRRGQWRLAPAFDITFSYNPKSVWTGLHQMTLGGKRDRFTRQDLIDLALNAGFKTVQANKLLNRVIGAVKNWRTIAEENGLPAPYIDAVETKFRIADLKS